MVVVWLLVGIYGISAKLQDIGDTEIYTTPPGHGNNQNCQICYESDCFGTDGLRCEYYREAESILRGDDDDDDDDYKPRESEMKKEIDNLLQDYVDKALEMYTTCVPLISQYTNCYRENICTGCEICTCTTKGTWNCSTIQLCRPDGASISVNHRTLVLVMENLENLKEDITATVFHKCDKRSLLKRRNKRMTDDKRDEKDTMRYEDVLKWLYKLESFNNGGATNSSEKSMGQNTTTEPADNGIRVSINTLDSTDPELLSFDELLNIINNNNEYKLLKPIDFVTHNELNMKDVNNTEDTKNTTISNIYYDPVAKVPIFNYFNDLEDEIKTLRKRSVKMESSTGKINHSDVTYNSSSKIKELQTIVLYPLIKLVNEKEKELKTLINVKEKLIKYLKLYNDINIATNITNNSVPNDNAYLYLYQFTLPKDSKEYLTEGHPNILNEYLKKLKKDIFEVVIDIATLQILSSSSTISQDLKVMTQATKRYVHPVIKPNRINNTKTRPIINLRSNFDQNIKKVNPIDTIIKIMQLLDVEMPLNNALKLLSIGAKKVLMKIIQRFYYDSHEISHQRMFNHDYDIKNDLKNLGTKWHEIELNFIEFSLPDRLYCFKLLHLWVSEDIDKIKNTLALVQFAQYRRMTIIEDPIGERIISKIGNDLQRINLKVKQIIQLQNLRSKSKSPRHKNISYNKNLNKLNGRKKSLFQYIKQLLKDSKKEIRDFLKKKVYKSEIIKHITKKKMDEIKKKKPSDYEETMRRWQSNLDVVSRNKRATGQFKRVLSRIKNIIPGYLRKKVKPAVNKSLDNKTKARRHNRAEYQQ